MSHEKNKLFRQEALERLSSPEQLDKLIQVVTCKDCLPLGGLAVLGFLGLLWSIFGKIPVTVSGQGVLINPGRVIPFQSAISGQLKSLNVSSGQCVKKDDILAIIDPSAKKQELQQQRDRLAQLNQQIERSALLRQQRNAIENTAIATERSSLEQKLQATRNLTPLLQVEGLNSISQQRQSLQQKLLDARELTPILEQRLLKQTELLELGAISRDRVLQAEQDYRQTRQQLSEIQAQLQELRLQESKLQQQYLENTNSIAQIKAELAQLTTRSKQLEQNNLEASNNEENQIQEIEQTIVRLEKEVADNSFIKSLQDGCILETTATVGQYINPGTRLGSLQTEVGLERMVSVAYFSIEDGKKVQQGMPVSIAPDTVKRTRFGGIVGQIQEISPFPVTSDRAESLVGNPEVVRKLMEDDGGKIEAISKLKLDSQTYSGYQWTSSGGPELKITSGTTATVRVTVEERAPITWVLPILREWSGL